MIVVQLLGGLGNQLFQYCFGCRLATELGTKLYVDSRLLRDHSRGRHLVNRNYALDIFEANVREAPLSHVIRYSTAGLPKFLRGVLKLVGISNSNRQTIENGFGYDPTTLQSQPPSYLAGLWQSQQYFQPIEEKIREELRFRGSVLNPVSEGLVQEIRSQESVCLHVRRGDYVQHSQSDSPLGFIGMNYYKTAVSEMFRLHPETKFFIFSDDLEWCRTELSSFVPRATFVGDEHAGFKDGGHLKLMSLCKYFIIPNSTFSWWAAWLSDRESKKVMLPDPWFRDPNFDASGFYVQDWIRIASE